jgi:2,4-dichlorophenol 6-monooxygenase
MRNTDVLIVGGGGCGMVLSCLLSDLGVDFLTVEKSATTSILPKAHYLNPRTMEILHQHGLADEIFQQGTPPYNRSKSVWYTSFGGDGPLDRKVIHSMGGLGGHGTDKEIDYRESCPVDSANLPQIRLEPIFKAHSLKRAEANMLFEHEFLELEQDAHGVTATVKDLKNNSIYKIRAKYMVAADGGRTVGKQLGVVMKGQQNLITQIGVHFEADLSDVYPDDRVLLNWIRTPKRPGVSVVVPMGPNEWGRHSPEWSIGFAKMPFDNEFTEENVIPVVKEILGLPDLKVKVRAVSQWTVGGVLADKYQIGRVLLAGDAAHRHPPTTGLGLNTAIQDAHNLAWKLALVCRGIASEKFIETYQTERKPIGDFNVTWALNAFFNHVNFDFALLTMEPGDLMKLQSPDHVVNAYTTLFEDSPNGRNRRARLKTIMDTQAIEFYARDVEMGFVYEHGALVRDGTPSPKRDPLGEKYVPTTRPGHRLPHAWIDWNKRTVSTHDLVGKSERFVLLCNSSESTPKWKAAAHEVSTKFGLKIECISIGNNSDANDTEARWRDLSEISMQGAILIRPDNIVGWRSHDAPIETTEALIQAMNTILNL